MASLPYKEWWDIHVVAAVGLTGWAERSDSGGEEQLVVCVCLLSLYIISAKQDVAS